MLLPKIVYLFKHEQQKPNNLNVIYNCHTLSQFRHFSLLTMSLQNEEALIRNGRIILNVNLRGTVRAVACFSGLSCRATATG